MPAATHLRTPSAAGRRRLGLALLTVAPVLLASCDASSSGGGAGGAAWKRPVALAPAPAGSTAREDRAHNTEAYDRIDDNPLLAADRNPLSTFSIDVDTASYANVR